MPPKVNKRRRTRLLAQTSLLGNNYSKLSKVLSLIRSLDDADRELLMSGTSRSTLKRSVDEISRQFLDRVDVPTLSGPAMTIYIVNIAKLWTKILEEHTAGYAAELLRLPRSTAESPWSLVLWGDEAVPGNVMNPDNHRKTFALAFSLKDFGVAFLTHVVAWMPLCLVRTEEHHEVRGGMSGVLRQLLRHLFLTQRVARGLDCGRLGSVYLELGNIVMDGDAFHLAFCFFASKALLPCTCINVFHGRRPQVFGAPRCRRPAAPARVLRGSVGASARAQGAARRRRPGRSETLRGHHEGRSAWTAS